jgi:hypothetical protein
VEQRESRCLNFGGNEEAIVQSFALLVRVTVATFLFVSGAGSAAWAADGPYVRAVARDIEDPTLRHMCDGNDKPYIGGHAMNGYLEGLALAATLRSITKRFRRG